MGPDMKQTRFYLSQRESKREPVGGGERREWWRRSRQEAAPLKRQEIERAHLKASTFRGTGDGPISRFLN